MTISIPLGRRRLVVTVAALPLRARRNVIDATVEASDAELARLAARRPDDGQLRWDALAPLYGGRW